MQDTEQEERSILGTQDMLIDDREENKKRQKKKKQEFCACLVEDCI
jgi:hypothetical protein